MFVRVRLCVSVAKKQNFKAWLQND
jgi:hypothetical protein